MNKTLLFQHFDRIAEAPDAILRLRRFILDLAVRGKLVPTEAELAHASQRSSRILRENVSQKVPHASSVHGVQGSTQDACATLAPKVSHASSVPTDTQDACPTFERASELLKRIEAEKALLVKGGKIRKPKPLPPIDPEEVPFEIPEGWEWVLFGQGFDIQGGTQPPKSQFLSEPKPGYVRLVQIRDLGSNPVPTYVRKDSCRRFCSEKDILIGRYGASVGKIFWGIEGAYNVALAKLRYPEDRWHPRFLFNLLQTSVFQDPLKDMSRSAQAGFNKGDLARIHFPLPPLAEQHRIVSKVDELMAICDDLERAKQEREARKDRFVAATHHRLNNPEAANGSPATNGDYRPHARFFLRKDSFQRLTILNLAVRGKLVAQDPDEEPAAQALGRISAAPKRAMRTRATDGEDSGSPSETESLFELPSGWEWTLFRRLPLQASVGIDRRRSMQGPDKAFGYFKMNNIRNSGGVDFSDLTRIDATPCEVEEFCLADGDFLFNTRNSRELVGKTCVFRAPCQDPILYNNNILRVKFIEGFSPDFLDYWFRSPQGRAELEKLKSNTTNVCAIYQGKLAGFPCPIPPIPEQRRIVAKVDELMALVGELETQINASHATAEILTDAIVSELTRATSN